MQWFGALADVSSIAALLLLVGGFALARRRARSHLVAHLNAVRAWARGPEGAGWSMSHFTPTLQFRWRHPRHATFPLESAGAISQLTLLQDILLSEAMTQRLVALSQGIATFNAHLRRAQDWVTADPVMTAMVATKLDHGYKTVKGAGSDDGSDLSLTSEEFNQVLEKGNLDARELVWATALAQILVVAHMRLISDASGRGVYTMLKAVDEQMRVEGWDL